MADPPLATLELPIAVLLPPLAVAKGPSAVALLVAFDPVPTATAFTSTAEAFSPIRDCVLGSRLCAGNCNAADTRRDGIYTDCRSVRCVRARPGNPLPCRQRLSYWYRPPSKIQKSCVQEHRLQSRHRSSWLPHRRTLLLSCHLQPNLRHRGGIRSIRRDRIAQGRCRTALCRHIDADSRILLVPSAPATAGNTPPVLATGAVAPPTVAV